MAILYGKTYAQVALKNAIIKNTESRIVVVVVGLWPKIVANCA